MKITPAAMAYPQQELFRWTATWVNTFIDRKEDILVFVNHQTRYIVVAHGVRRSKLKFFKEIFATALFHTMLASGYPGPWIEHYLAQAGMIQYCANHDRQKTSWVNTHGREAAIGLGELILEHRMNETLQFTYGSRLSKALHGDGKTFRVPEEDMYEALQMLWKAFVPK